MELVRQVLPFGHNDAKWYNQKESDFMNLDDFAVQIRPGEGMED